MSHPKSASPENDIHPLIAERWSPYAYDPRPVEEEKLLACLEAARWAPSSFNEQPWRFIIAHREQQAQFQALLGCLVEANQAWAKDAGVLVITVVSRSFQRNGNPNRMADHDMGLAIGNLSSQATHLGLGVHQMAGVNLSKARQVCQLPDGYDPLTAITIGYTCDDGESEFAGRDQQPRQRTAIAEFCFQGTFGEPLR